MSAGSNSEDGDVLTSGLPVKDVSFSVSNEKARDASVASKRASGFGSGGAVKAAGAFKTISEVADELDVQQHVLRFWETKFSYVRPLKRGGGRRYYRPEDVQILKAIHALLYTDGYTIKGVQKLLREKGKNAVLDKYILKSGSGEAAAAAPAAAPALNTGPLAQRPQSYVESVQRAKAAPLSDDQKRLLRSMLDELKEIRGMIGQNN